MSVRGLPHTLISVLMTICFSLRYCPTCKEQREASKQMSVWRLPHTLVIQLKRFSFRNALWRDKIDKLVEFPVRWVLTDIASCFIAMFLFGLLGLWVYSYVGKETSVLKHTCTHTHTQTFLHTHTHTHMLAHTHTHARIRVCMHTYTHMYTHTLLFLS